MNNKEKNLRRRLRELSPVAIAFSGGVDSTYLLHVAVDELGVENVLALTAISPVYPKHEQESCRTLADAMGVHLLEVTADVLANPDFVANDRERCYKCKLDLFGEFIAIVKKRGIDALLDGSNLDDLADYRPGHKALGELNVHSPLLEAELTKNEIRQLSRAAGLPTWNKQPFACLATRFPYGTEITAERLQQVGSCEEFLYALGLANYRVRYHDNVARLEVAPEELSRFLDPELRQKVSAHFHAAGFEFVTIDLDGYRTGSMNGPDA
jgi:uncharacterized protein